MKVLILDTNRRETAGLMYHYTKLGHEVFYIKPNSTNLINWKETILWPVLLTWSREDPTKTNFEYHKFNELKEFEYGEDNFLLLEDFVQPISDKSLQVKLVDIEKENNFFDAVHILPHFFGESFENIKKIIELYCKGAKIINSAFDPGNMKERIGMFPNQCEFLPAVYQDFSKQIGSKNSVHFLRHPVELELLGIEYEKHKNDWKDKKIFSSFMHNFEARQGKQTVDMFHSIADFVKKEADIDLINFGGNIRGQGADLRYDLNAGITGNYKTLSPRNAFKQYFSSRGILHLKYDDWAGGVEIGARASGTPMIVFSHYFKYTNLQRTWGPILENETLYSADTPQNIVNAIITLLDDNKLETKKETIYNHQKNIFDKSYWNSWEMFLDNLE